MSEGLPWPYNLPWPEDTEPTYESIGAFAQQHGINRGDLVALSDDNDPFYAGRESRRRDAGWFSALYARFGFGERWERSRLRAHLRSLLYNWTQQQPVPALPRTLARGQTALLIDKECWQYLISASGDARYLDLVDPAAIKDEKTPDAVDRKQTERHKARIDVERNAWGDLELPEFPDPPGLALCFTRESDGLRDHYQSHLYGPGLQRYHQEDWTEKGTMDDVLRVVCSQFHVTQQSAQGEFTLTKALELCERVRVVGKPAIVWYKSDLDPGGKSMPVAFSRKVEWCIRHIPAYRDLDIRVIPLVLSRAQVEHYGLPLTAIKDSEGRGARFEERDGKGSCELDAVEALHPGELPRLAGQAFGHFHDEGLEERCLEVEERIREDMVAAEEETAPSFEERYSALKDQYEALAEEFKERLRPLNEEYAALCDDWVQALEDAKPDLDDEAYARPEAEEADEGVILSLPAIPKTKTPPRDLPLQVLFDSRRGYLEQLYAYHRFQGRELPQPPRGSDTRERVLELRREHPDWSGARIAAEAGVNRGTVSRLLRASE